MGLMAIAAAMPEYPGRKTLEGALRPLVASAGRVYAGHKIQRLLGYWVLVHAMGGREGLVKARMISRVGEWNQQTEFRAVFGVEVEDFMPEIAAGLARGVWPKGRA